MSPSAPSTPTSTTSRLLDTFNPSSIPLPRVFPPPSPPLSLLLVPTSPCRPPHSPPRRQPNPPLPTPSPPPPAVRPPPVMVRRDTISSTKTTTKSNSSQSYALPAQGPDPELYYVKQNRIGTYPSSLHARAPRWQRPIKLWCWVVVCVVASRQRETSRSRPAVAARCAPTTPPPCTTLPALRGGLELRCTLSLGQTD